MNRLLRDLGTIALIGVIWLTFALMAVAAISAATRGIRHPPVEVDAPRTWEPPPLKDCPVPVREATGDELWECIRRALYQHPED